MRHRIFSEYLAHVKNFWNRSDENKTLVFNLVLGALSIAFFCCVLKDLKPTQDSINWYLDHYVLWRLNAEEDNWFDKYVLFGKAADMETRRIAKDELYFLTFDADVMKAFNRPSSAPRDKIADLLKTAYEGEAAIVVVDFDFSQPDYTPAKTLAGDDKPLTGQERDKVLRDLLKKIRDDPYSKTKVLLMRTVYADQTEQPNIFADLIDGKKIFEVTPQHSQAGTNVRFWTPYVKMKNADTNQPRVLWSVPIMTLVLTHGNLDELHNVEQKILDDNNDEVDKYHLTINRRGVVENFPIYEEQQKGSSVVRDTTTGQYNRIQYVLFPSVLGGNIDIANQARWERTGVNLKYFNCKNKIVVIGRTDEDSGDLHYSPAGMMPGMYVHANAIATVLSTSRPHLCSTFMHVMIEIVLVIIAAYVFFTFKGPKVGYLLLLMFAACWVLPFFYYCFTNEYIFLNMAFMSAGVCNLRKILEKASWKGVSNLPKLISMWARR